MWSLITNLCDTKTKLYQLNTRHQGLLDGRLSFLNSNKTSKVQFLNLKIPKKLYETHRKAHRSTLTRLKGGDRETPYLTHTHRYHVHTVQYTVVSQAFERAIFCAVMALISYNYCECEQSLGCVSVEYAAVNSWRRAESSVYTRETGSPHKIFENESH